MSNHKEQLLRVLVAYPSFAEHASAAGDRRGTLTAWARRISKCDIDDVTAVVDQIVRGDLEPVGEFQSKDQLPSTIKHQATKRAQARKTQERMAALTARDDVGRYRCPNCFDSGFIEIWHPDAVAAFRRAGESKRIAANAACNCASGVRHQHGRPGWPGLPAFDSRCMAPFNAGDVDALRDWIAEQKPPSIQTHNNYQRDFAEWES